MRAWARLPRQFPRLRAEKLPPPSAAVQDWFLLLLVAKEDGLTWDETMERLNKTPLNQATDEWLRSLPGLGAEAERVAAR